MDGDAVMHMRHSPLQPGLRRTAEVTLAREVARIQAVTLVARRISALCLGPASGAPFRNGSLVEASWKAPAMTPSAKTVCTLALGAAARRAARPILVVGLALSVAACGGSGGKGGLFGLGPSEHDKRPVNERRESTIWDLFSNRDTSNQQVAVNRYLWNASLDVLNFLPIQSVDPFTGVIVTGYGTPPGGGRSYRATVRISDPALDARSLKLSLQGAGGSAVAPDTVRAVEDAILTRARQLRVRDGQL